MNRSCSRKSGVETILEDRKTLLQKLQRNSRNQRGSPFECRSGQNVMDYSVSKTASMSCTIWSFVITLLCSIMTRGLWDTLVTGTGIPELLVATNILLHQSVHWDM